MPWVEGDIPIGSGVKNLILSMMWQKSPVDMKKMLHVVTCFIIFPLVHLFQSHCDLSRLMVLMFKVTFDFLKLLGPAYTLENQHILKVMFCFPFQKIRIDLVKL